MIRTAFASAIALLVAIPDFADAKTQRSSAAKAEFQRENPCPATGQRRGKCSGYVIDHVTPLCAGGEDAPRNMQWQTVADAKEKDKDERRLCRSRTDGRVCQKVGNMIQCN